MKDRKKCLLVNLRLFLVLILALVIIPGLLVSIQNHLLILNDLNNTNEAIFPKPSTEYVFYEDTDGYANGIYVSGDYAYVADERAGLAIIDISDPTNPGTPIYEDLSKTAYDISVSGDYAYMAASGAGLAIINISDPTNPGTPIYKDLTASALGVYVSGDYAYVGDRESGLAIINISDPANPGTPLYVNTTGYATGVYVNGDFAYVGTGESGLAIIKISDPDNIGYPVYVNTPGYARNVHVKGNYAYIADSPPEAFGTARLAVVDISNPSIPGTPIYVNTLNWAYGLYVSGDYAYIGDYNDGLAVVDISNPTILGPAIYIYEDSDWDARDIYVKGDYAYVANGYYGLAVVDISDFVNPKIIDAPSDFTVDYNNAGVNISWTATDSNPNTYTIELQGAGIVAGPSEWSNGTLITYSVPSGLEIGDYIYQINLTDDYDNYITDTVIMTVIENVNPIIVNVPSDFTVFYDYDGVNISWTATDSNPDTYTIELRWTGIVTGPSVWSNMTPITYNVPNGLEIGNYFFTINLIDACDNYVNDTVTMTVVENVKPIIINKPSDFTVYYDYMGLNLTWTATDSNPNTYTIELQGAGIVAGPSGWLNGTQITHDIPNGLVIGSYTYIVNFSDTFNNYITDAITVNIIDKEDDTESISYGNYYLIFLVIGIISLGYIQIRRR